MSDETDDNEILATVRASAGRRLLGIGALWSLAILVVYVALAEPPALGWQIFLIVFGGCSAWLAEQMRRATDSRIELTRVEVRDSSGTVLARVEDIDGIDRGMFAFKPSNGFLLHTKTKQKGAWRPGLWWRSGRRIGVGGMTPGHEAKFMAELITALMAERQLPSE